MMLSTKHDLLAIVKFLVAIVSLHGSLHCSCFVDWLTLLQYNLEDANNTFTARFGDRVGWTFLTGSSVVVFTYDAKQKTYFFNLGPNVLLPTVGSIFDFDGVSLPVTYSVAVRLDLSKFVRRSTH